MRRVRKRRRRRIKWKNVIAVFVLLICLIIFIVSSVKIFEWKVDSDDTKKQLDNINKIIQVEEVLDNDKTEIVEQEEEISKVNPYWDYIKMNLINVDFMELKLINAETKGWIQVNGTNVNYPFVQAKDNDYYLTRSFDKSLNDAGWVFLDYRNDIDNMDKNTIIYAHGRNDKTMFGSLRTILTNGWLNDKNNFVIKLSTESENTLWQVFSIYRVPTTSDYLQVNFYDNEDFINFTDMLIDRSNYDFDTVVNASDRILTLSTCYDDYDKIVIHAKLIKKENR